ncbi:MAG: TrpR YerC/YecD [Oscillospiraceae bacterium]|nr:TrpR YerC/YecD [Oscillospiraceae bacterium]
MSNWYTREVKELFAAILTLKTEEECKLFFEDACTVKEIREIAQRLKVAKLLRDKVSYASINKETGVSTATISRVSRCLEYGNGGYALVMDRLKEAEES